MTAWTRRDLLLRTLAAAGVAAWSGCARLLPGSNGARASRLPWRNWAGDHLCRPRARVVPRDEEELTRAIARSRGTIRPVGAGHSFSPVVSTEDVLVACDRMSGVIRADRERLEAEVWAGTRLHALGPALDAVGQALPVQPDIDDQVLGGAIATSTHGTGRAFGSLSSYVTGLTLATPSGELIECDRDREPEIFDAARCSVGALGVVTRLRLANAPPRRLEELVQARPIDELLEDAETLRDTHRHMEFLALPYARVGLLATTDETDDRSVVLDEDPHAGEQLREAWAAVGGDADVYRAAVAQALGGPPARRVGPSYRVMAHARYTRFREMEYTVPAALGPACLREILEAIEAQALLVVFPIEYRYVKADDIPLSMFSGRDGASISIHQYADLDASPIFDALEPIFWRHQGRPHWGKLHSLDGSRLAALYPDWASFQRVRRALDPNGRMLNDHLRRLFDGAW